jgi:glycosyltransferase involved in cell wall biosynthesis
VPYKRLETAIDAARMLGEPLSIVGTGPELSRLQGRAGDGVTFLGWRSNEEIRTLYQQSAATLLPGVEDFGLVPVEAQACGCPVVALSEGGAAETVVDGETGVLVAERSTDAFAAGITRLRTLALDPDRLRQHAETFSRERFLAEFRSAVNDACAAARQPLAAAARRTRPSQEAAAEDQQ